MTPLALNVEWPSCPIYIEMVGPSGVGKTTVIRHIAQSLQGRPVYLRGGLRKRQFQNFVNTLLSIWRVRHLLEFYRYLRIDKKVPRAPALRRAVAITGIPACRKFLRAKNGVLLVEEGPLLYLTSCGGYGEAWKDWGRVFLPDGRDVRSFFIVLRASQEEIFRRRKVRGRVRRARSWPKGTEGMTDELQEQARSYWLKRLSAEGACCIEIDTEAREPTEIAQIIVDQVKSLTLDRQVSALPCFSGAR